MDIIYYGILMIVFIVVVIFAIRKSSSNLEKNEQIVEEAAKLRIEQLRLQQEMLNEIKEMNRKLDSLKNN
ncbi:hypothetical protein [Evansella halocellulosilytica]|uniref:hypothetical protein n=1 Tax=Evansella halocellulosilytica TaxID=2011013 RepID=UPI000BB825E1|nr:hypothetical protein [Evansella halocellulosilytica]